MGWGVGGDFLGLYFQKFKIFFFFQVGQFEFPSTPTTLKGRISIKLLALQEIFFKKTGQKCRWKITTY